MKHLSGSPYPSQNQELLLQAALLDGHKMLDAWEKWTAIVDFETDIESASFRMLPLLYFNLHSQSIDHHLMPRLKGIYRQSWSKNHILFHKTAAVLRLLFEEGIPTLIMKGIALSILVYKNDAVRPMADMDILIPLSYARQTIDFLSQKGWVIQNEQFLEYNLKYGRSVTFWDNNKTELDLHWHPVFEAHDEIAEDDFWSFAIPVEVSGVKTKAFCTTDNLFHAIVHGMRYNPEPPIRWVADAFVMINSGDENINWERLLLHTRKFRVHLQMKEALHYLIEKFDAPVPNKVIDELEKIKSTFTDRLVFRHAKKYGDNIPTTVYEKIYSVYAGYLRQSSEKGLWAQHLGFLKYMRFRNRGKPYFRILIFYISLLFKITPSKNKS